MKLLRRSHYALAALLVLAVLAAFAGTAAFAAGFTDVPSSAWYYSAVNFVTSKGLFNGTSTTQFSPGQAMTRSMFITVLGRYANIDADAWCAGMITGSDVNLRSGPGTGYDAIATLDAGDVVTLLGRSGSWYQVRSGSRTGYVSGDYVSARYHGFSDVSYGSYYTGYAIWAYENGIVTGDGSSSVFSPNGVVTRQQVCTFLGRFASVMGVRLSQNTAAVTFKDESSISSWARESVAAMQRAGVVEGDEKGNFNPGSSATRAQAAAMLQRFDIACGGFKPPVTPTPKPTQTPAPTRTPAPTPTPGGSGGATTPAPGFPEDTPATLIGGTVRPRFTVVRVGLQVSTSRFHNAVQQVKLYNTNGSGFSYGSMGPQDRRFYSTGTINDRTITVTTNGNAFTVTNSRGETVCTVSGAAIALRPIGANKGLTKVNDNYSYFGDFELRQVNDGGNKINVINFVDIEDYVKGVLPYEFSASWPAETLKAAAVASRSFIMKTDLAYTSYGMDIVADDGGQLYLGRRTYSDSYFSASDAAVDATRNMYLTYNGDICLCSFSACDGGQTRSAREVFGTSYPYLAAKADPYEAAAKKDVAAAGINYESWVAASHRVGLSQWGAFAMGKYYSKTYQDILGFYYTGTHLQYGA